MRVKVDTQRSCGRPVASRALSLPPAQEGGPARTHGEGHSLTEIPAGPAPAGKWVWKAGPGSLDLYPNVSGSPRPVQQLGSLVPSLSLFTSKPSAWLIPGLRTGRGSEAQPLPSPIAARLAGHQWSHRRPFVGACMCVRVCVRVPVHVREREHCGAAGSGGGTERHPVEGGPGQGWSLAPHSSLIP